MAYVIPLIEKIKDPADVGNYCPIDLTSTIGKVLKRLIANCLSWWLAEHSAISPWQAGFSKGRSTIDLWLSQFISDGLQSTQSRRNVATFLDFSRAYDHVWRTGLLMNISKIGVLIRFTEWLSSWFINRTVRVRVNGSMGPSRTFK